jgi:hypothetical protein
VIGIDGRAPLAALPVVLALLLGIYFGHFQRKSNTTWIPWQGASSVRREALNVLSQGRGLVQHSPLREGRTVWTSSNTTPGQCRSLLEVAQLTPSVTAHAHYSLLAAHFPPKPALRSSLHWNLLVCTRCIAPGVMQNCVHLPPVPPRIQKYQVSSEFPLLPTLSHWKAPSGWSEDGCKYHGREFEASIKPPRFPHVSPALTQKVQ